jgi:hypothetical protein
MFKEVWYLGINLGLYLEMANLTEGNEIPPFIATFIAVEMMSCEYPTWNAGTSATDAFIPGRFSGRATFLLAVWVILSRESSH